MKNETNNSVREDMFPASNRPISAVNKRPSYSSKIFQNNSRGLTQKVKGDFPNLFHNNLITEFSRFSSGAKGIEKEKLHEDNLVLKSTINKLKKELASYKSEIVKKDQEINKKDKVLEDIVTETQNDKFSFDSLGKVKEGTLVNKLKKQYKELKKEFEAKCEELDICKKALKLTKMNEMTVEIKTLTEELLKIRSLYEHSLQQNEILEKSVQDMSVLQDNFSKQHFIIISLQENLTKLNEENRKKDEESNKLKEKVNSDANLIKKLKKDMSLIQMNYDRLAKEKRDSGDVSNLKAQYEKKIGELMNEVNHYKEVANRSERRCKELQQTLSGTKGLTNSLNSNQVQPFNYNEIKYIQESPEETDSKVLLLKSLLQEAMNSKAELEKRNKELEDCILNAEGKKPSLLMTNKKQEDHLRHSDGIQPNEKLSEDQLAEMTYVLIKNFEAKIITKEVAMEKIIKEVLEKYPDDSAIAKEDIITRITEKMCGLLKNKNNSDAKRIKMFINDLFDSCEGELQVFLEKFMSLFFNVRCYEENEQEVYSTKIKKYLGPYLEFLTQALTKNDKNNSGYISFIDLRKILESADIRLKDKYIEYLIYAMKQFDDDKSSIYDLNYKTIFKIVKESKNDSKMNEISQEEDGNEEESGEIVITTDQYLEKVNSLLMKISNLMNVKGSKVKKFFKKIIYSTTVPETKTQADVINIKDFVEELKENSIELDTIDIYCLYNKFRLVDGFEAISVDILEDEIENYGKNKDSNEKKNLTDSSDSSDKVKKKKKLPEVIERDEDSIENFGKFDKTDSFISNRIENVKANEDFEDYLSKPQRPTTAKPLI